MIKDYFNNKRGWEKKAYKGSQLIKKKFNSELMASKYKKVLF